MPVPPPFRHVVLCNWRDTSNPEGGGSERYVERMARGLAARGCRVTVCCARHDNAPDDEIRDGVRFVRRGGKLGVYPKTLAGIALRRLGPIDLVVDVQNGMPFFTRLATGRPVVVLVHHVHREQWPVVYPGPAGRVGWWIESVLSPRLYAGCQYVAVSAATRDELGELGIDPGRIAVVHNGSDPAPDLTGERAATPTICVVGRLVPHKRIEHAIDAVAQLRARFPDLRCRVAGAGWWEESLQSYAVERGVAGAVEFLGHVDEAAKHELYANAWVQALPSLKEGWGLVVGEAGAHATPTVAYRSARGTRESIVDAESGILVDSQADFVGALARLLNDAELRERLGKGAHEQSVRYSWQHAEASFVSVLSRAYERGRTGSIDP
ncbi:MAG TPA: glycosyltransferase family 4 protein [Nocardioidaceae bacterium]|nr:glycosyltransferase family 4 protein [Nocardioidaceae bacterium]